MSEMRILIVDDAPDIRAVVKEIINLRDTGWHVIGEATNGAAGIELARSEQPDLVLLDISMPVMDGLEALPGMQQVAPNSVVVILTGYPTRAAREQAIAAGAAGFVEKDDIVCRLVPHLEAILRGLGHRTATDNPEQPTAADLPGAFAGSESREREGT